MKNPTSYLSSGIVLNENPILAGGKEPSNQFGSHNFPPAQPPSKRVRHGRQSRGIEETPLSVFVRERLAELGVRQADFCRQNQFDQGLMSKIQNSVINNLSLETVLRLSIGLSVPPEIILRLIDRTDLHDLVLAAYAHGSPGLTGVPPY
jgi:transcriptional regulator with XRE-family HTH domain